MSITINPPAGHWTIDDLDRIEADGYRVELHEGNLVIMSPATAWHSVVILRLANALLAMGLPAITEIGVKRSGRDLRVADIAVFREAVTDLDIAFWAPGDIATVIEVVSESSELDDRVTKPLWYAEVGQNEPQAHSHRPWYKDKVSPTFADMLGALRLQLWEKHVSSRSGSDDDHAKLLDSLINWLAAVR